MSYEFTMGSGGVPVGNYPAEFVGAEDFTSDNGKDFGPALVLKWRGLSGEQAGQTASRIVSKKMSPKSGLGKMAVQLKGAAIATGEVFRIADYIGVRGYVMVEPTESGGTRVSTFLREAATQAQRPTPPPVDPPQDAHEAEDVIPF